MSNNKNNSSKFKKKVGNYNKKIKEYLINENKPWTKQGLLLQLGITRAYLYDLRHGRIKKTKEIEKFLIKYEKINIIIEQELLKEALVTPQAKLEYWKLAYQFKRNKKIEQELLKENENKESNINITINIDKPREIPNE